MDQSSKFNQGPVQKQKNIPNGSNASTLGTCIAASAASESEHQCICVVLFCVRCASTCASMDSLALTTVESERPFLLFFSVLKTVVMGEYRS